MRPLNPLGRLGPLARVQRDARRPAPAQRTRPPITVSLTPLGLDLGLAALAVEAVSAGPVWLGTHGLAADGSVSLDLGSYAPAAGLTVLVRATYPASAQGYLYGMRFDADNWAAGNSEGASIWHYLRVAGAIKIATAVRPSGTVTRAFAFSESSGSIRPDIVTDVATAAGNGSLVCAWSAQLQIGAWGAYAASAGYILRDIAILPAVPLPSDVAAFDAGADWGQVAAARGLTLLRYYDPSNVYDSGSGVWKVRDLITTDGSTDATVVGGDNTDFVAV